MLAVGLVAAISGGVFTFLFNLGVGRGGVERGAEGLRGAAALLDGLDGDVAGAIAVDSDGAGGVIGDETSLKLLTRGVAPPVVGSGMEGVASDLQGVEYRFDEAARELTARRGNVLGGRGRGECRVQRHERRDGRLAERRLRRPCERERWHRQHGER